MKIKDIQILTYNPFFCSEILAHFLSGCNNRSVNYDLIFLVLPLVLKRDSRDLLKSSNSRSTLYSTFLSKKEGKISLGGIDERYNQLKDLTQVALIIAAKRYDLSVSDSIKMTLELDYNKESSSLLKAYYRAAYSLGIIFSSSKLFDIYLKLGIKQI